MKIRLEIPTEFETGVRHCPSCLIKGLGEGYKSKAKIILDEEIARVSCACGTKYLATYEVAYDPTGKRTRVEFLSDDAEISSNLDDYFIGRKDDL